MSGPAQQGRTVQLSRAVFWAWALCTLALAAGSAWGWSAFEKYRQVRQLHDAILEHNRNIGGFLQACTFETKWLRSEREKRNK